jgi:hypothetical protein
VASIKRCRRRPPSNAPATTATATTATTAIAAVTTAAATTATATPTTATTAVKLAATHCQIKRQEQQHHQRTSGSTKVKTITSPYLFNLSTVFELVEGI